MYIRVYVCIRDYVRTIAMDTLIFGHFCLLCVKYSDSPFTVDVWQISEATLDFDSLKQLLFVSVMPHFSTWCNCTFIAKITK